MRIDSHRLATTLIALGFLAGWFSASWVSPPTAVTQVRPTPPAVTTPDVPMPQIALHAVRAPESTPSAARNPFVFTDRAIPTGAGTVRTDEHPASAPAASDAVATSERPSVAEPPLVSWQIVGLATESDGRVTAVISGAGDVHLLTLGDRLPDGALVVEVDAGGVVMTTSTGDRVTLRLH